MRKYLLVIMVVIGLMCGGFTTVTAQAADVVDTDAGNLGRVLVAYYSFTGNTVKVAEALAGRFDSDLYRIETVEQYAENPRDQLKTQREQNQWPKLKEPLPDIGAYDTVFIGMPVWGGDVPPPVVTFLQQADFNGKRIAYFCTAGPRPREFMDHFKDYVKTGEIVAGMNFGDLYQNKTRLDEAIINWLAEINILINP